MAKIPRIEPGGARLTQQTGQATIDPGMATKESKAIGNLASVAQEGIRKFDELYTAQKTDEAKLSIYKGMTEMDELAKNDPNIDEPEIQNKYFEQMAELKGKVLAEMPEGIAKADVDNAFEMTSIKAQVDIRSYGRTASMHKSIATFNEKTLILKDNYIKADPEARSVLWNAMTKNIVALKDKGFILPEKAQEMEVKSKQDWNTQAALKDTEIYGIDYVLSHMGNYDVDDKEKLKTEVGKMQKRIDTISDKKQTEIKNQTIREQIKKLNTDEFDKQEVEELYQKGIIELKDRDDLLARYYKVDVKTDYGEYNKLKERAEGLNNLDGNAETNRDKIIRDILASKNLKPEDTEELIDKVYSVEDTQDKNTIKNEGKGLEAWATQVIGENVAVEIFSGEIRGQIDELTYKFYNRVNQEQAKGERIAEISQEIRDEYVKSKHPELTDVDVIPDVIVSIEGQVKRLLGFGGKKSDKKAKPKFKITRTNDSLSGKN